jgi:hypothetical protein
MILRRSGVLSGQHWVTPRSQYLVYRTKADQLVGSYSALVSFRNAFPKHYKEHTHTDPRSKDEALVRTWQAHHVVEVQDLKVLQALGRKFPTYRYLPCVLLPYEAHQQRVNDLLERGPMSTMSDLLDYANAYDAIGSYTGADEQRIRNELVAICRTMIETPYDPSPEASAGG